MAKQTLSESTARLRELNDAGDVPGAEKLLAKILREHGASALPALLTMRPGVNYEEDFGDEMWELLHTAEGLGDDVYVPQLLNNASTIYAASPRLFELLVLRIMNNDEATESFIARLKSVPKDEKPSIVAALKAVDRTKPTKNVKAAIGALG